MFSNVLVKNAFLTITTFWNSKKKSIFTLGHTDLQTGKTDSLNKGKHVPTRTTFLFLVQQIWYQNSNAYFEEKENGKTMKFFLLITLQHCGNILSRKRNAKPCYF